MKKKEANEVLSIIYCEGYNYSFAEYSDFEEIKDEEFHKLRKDYVKAQEKLENYLFHCAKIKNWDEFDFGPEGE
jgi:hypothetical protein